MINSIFNLFTCHNQVILYLSSATLNPRGKCQHVTIVTIFRNHPCIAIVYKQMYREWGVINTIIYTTIINLCFYQFSQEFKILLKSEDFIFFIDFSFYRTILTYLVQYITLFRFVTKPRLRRF